ncbi:STAS domain-containing protein [Paenibacillus radicis (ex Xue et al. 2023)]|uniref:STAS domain-containing protein n=1 Tax=Paenibacillus radicis (ex Xue et al. 2023) TaxID=2972489 RepID=A0ABT1YR34_9BACL|nr:STAS domain-containing protein [Paenibacillus radicis (ex Xue et al. 2023)]MCR8635650.1 STAS domain-containing protein [Paenibacillus radicis (ex Xue et al. 2023)]
MCYEIKDSDQQIEVILTGIISVEEATSIRQKLFPILQQEFRSLTFHLGTVTEMDSSGLGLLLAVQKIAMDFNSSVSFKDVHGQLRERLNMAGIKL